MKVHGVLGNGFQEVIYQRALAIEFRLADIPFNREFEMPIFYKEYQIGTRRVDFLVENLISVEMKAIEYSDPVLTYTGIDCEEIVDEPAVTIPCTFKTPDLIPL